MDRRVAADGVTLVLMLDSALEWLEAGAPALDALNVFPVPDGDTGTNMLLTVRAARQALPREPAVIPAGAAAASMARGAIEGAHGNSGIILSQLFAGLASALEGKQAWSAADFASALLRAEKLARDAISNPAEGTILTVLTDVSRALAAPGPAAGTLADVLESAVAAAAASVERTPMLLPVLREAGVEDAGARGLLTILEGFLHALGNGRPQVRDRAVEAPRRLAPAGRQDSFGFCTEFLLAGEDLPLAAIRQRLGREGSSVILAGDARTARIHLHTGSPDAVIEYARSLGTVSRLEVQDLDRQCGALSRGATRPAPRTAILACVDGSGFAAVFRSMGAEVIEPADPAADPAPGDFERALVRMECRLLIVLPNSGKALAAARAAKPPGGIDVRIVPSVTLPQGIAALMAYRYDADADRNTAAMTAALGGVRTLEAAGPGAAADIEARLAREDPAFDGVITVFIGAAALPGAAERVAAFCRSRFPGATVETARGGQVRAHLVVSME
jgi:hypothetical protein